MAEYLEEDYEDDELEDVDAPPQPRGQFTRKKQIAFIILPILLVVGGMAGAYFSGIADPLISMLKIEIHPTTEPSKEVQAPVFYDLPEMLVNLDTEGIRQHFLKIQVSLELKSPLDASLIDEMMPRIIDNFQIYLRELRVEDLNGSAALVRLREDLLTRVNDTIKPVQVNDLLFKDILVQ